MPQPFETLHSAIPPRSALRQAITAQTRTPEMARMQTLQPRAELTPEQADHARTTALTLVTSLRKGGTAGIVQGLVREYDLSTQEGVALMCLAEALLRIPDAATRDALIRDKIAHGDWGSHVTGQAPLFVNAATWGLVLSGKMLKPSQTEGLAAHLGRAITRCGEPVIRRGVDMAMRLMGEQFVTGQTIEAALKNATRLERMGFRYSYDMLGEAAMTAADAKRYYAAYEHAIHAIGRAARGAGVYAGPGISVKLSALHPRYSRLQRDRVMAELLPRLQDLARLACQYDIGFNIDAEEADRLELSLDLLEALCADEALAGWKGIGFVVQAYQKRAPEVLDFVIDLARRSGRRLMVRLVKGAYWDSEIKRAQVDGQSDFPVYTTKSHTDIAYIACARLLLGAPDAVFPQFATHNAQTLASILALAGSDFSEDSYEFQCLHGMGEPLYNEVVGPKKLNRPVRIYAPVGTHETLLAYLVRRLLENGANSSFVNRIQDERITLEELATPPALRRGKPHVKLPQDLFAPDRRNSSGLDLTDERTIAHLAATLATPVTTGAQPVLNPADHRDIVGHVTLATMDDVDSAIARAKAAGPAWQATPAQMRSTILDRAADALEADTPALMALLVREAGKSFANAIAEIREAVDFLRYYAAWIRIELTRAAHTPLGPVVCISPWNFPLAIFLGQVAASLATGNTVLAKPAEETPLVAMRAVAILHEAGVPANALIAVIGAGDVGARLTAASDVRGVLFTGSTEVARLIQKTLATRLNPDGTPVPLIAETGGQNAMIVDSSALAEQVVADILASAFDSAGQRCSALRILCVQEDCADRTLAMLREAMTELRVGPTDRLEADIGPVISAEAHAIIEAHVASMATKGHNVHRAPLPDSCAHGTFSAPTLIEIDDIASLTREVFGPVLHVLRFRRDMLPDLLSAITATGYALTFGLHTRIDETIAAVTEQASAGNIYVNRNIVGAVVGSQPFGGHGLSGTGPKAGGPLYLRRLLASCPSIRPGSDLAHAMQGRSITLPGPVGEDNLYTLAPRGTILCAGPTPDALTAQIAIARSTGNAICVPAALRNAKPADATIWEEGAMPDAALLDGTPAERQALAQHLAEQDGPIIPLHVPQASGGYAPEWLLCEHACSTNTAAAGGNAALLAQA